MLHPRNGTWWQDSFAGAVLSFYGHRRQRRSSTEEGRKEGTSSSTSTPGIIRPRSPFYRSLRPRHSSLISPHERDGEEEEEKEDEDEDVEDSGRRVERA